MPLVTGHVGWAYLLIALLVALDAVLPLVPGEAAVLAGAAMAARGDLELAGVLAATVAGAFGGDLTSYAGGRLLGRPVLGRLAGRRAARMVLGWLGRHGVPVLVVARFVPGGRTASTLSAGMTRVPVRRFAACVGLGAVLWTAYLGGLGYAGGSLVAVPPLLLAAVLTVLAATAALVIARVRTRSTGRQPAPERLYAKVGR